MVENIPIIAEIGISMFFVGALPWQHVYFECNSCARIISRDVYLLFVILFSSKFQNSFFFTNAGGRNPALNPLGLKMFTRIDMFLL